MELTFQAATPAERLYTARHEADALFSLFHVAVQPVPAVAVDEQVFLPLVGLQPYQVGILRRVRPEAERKAVVTATPTERLYTARQSTQISGQTGSIGHRGITELPLRSIISANWQIW